jgi:hypothetical protein
VPGAGAAEVPRAGLLRYREAGPAGDVAGNVAAGDGESRVAALLAARGVRPVSYAEWLRIETAEADLAKSLGRGERVKLAGHDAIWSACRPSLSFATPENVTGMTHYVTDGDQTTESRSLKVTESRSHGGGSEWMSTCNVCC